MILRMTIFLGIFSWINISSAIPFRRTPGNIEQDSRVSHNPMMIRSENPEYLHQRPRKDKKIYEDSNYYDDTVYYDSKEEEDLKRIHNLEKIDDKKDGLYEYYNRENSEFKEFNKTKFRDYNSENLESRRNFQNNIEDLVLLDSIKHQSNYPRNNINDINEKWIPKNCSYSKKKSSDRYTSSFILNNTKENFNDGLFPNPGKVNVVKSSSVFYGEDVTLCWIETITIKEDKSIHPSKKVVLREYTISFENSATIPEMYLECGKFEGELESGCHNNEKFDFDFDLVDEDTKVSKPINFTTVTIKGNVQVKQYKSVHCAVGPVVTKTVMEFKDESKKPKKRVEVKVGPKLKKGNDESCSVNGETEKISPPKTEILSGGVRVSIKKPEESVTMPGSGTGGTIGKDLSDLTGSNEETTTPRKKDQEFTPETQRSSEKERNYSRGDSELGRITASTTGISTPLYEDVIAQMTLEPPGEDESSLGNHQRVPKIIGTERPDILDSVLTTRASHGKNRKYYPTVKKDTVPGLTLRKEGSAPLSRKKLSSPRLKNGIHGVSKHYSSDKPRTSDKMKKLRGGNTSPKSIGNRSVVPLINLGKGNSGKPGNLRSGSLRHNKECNSEDCITTAGAEINKETPKSIEIEGESVISSESPISSELPISSESSVSLETSVSSLSTKSYSVSEKISEIVEKKEPYSNFKYPKSNQKEGSMSIDKTPKFHPDKDLVNPVLNTEKGIKPKFNGSISSNIPRTGSSLIVETTECQEDNENCQKSVKCDPLKSSNCPNTLNNPEKLNIELIGRTTPVLNKTLDNEDISISNIGSTRGLDRLPKSKLGLRIKILLEHIDEKDEKKKLVELDKHLLLNEQMNERDNKAIVDQIKSLNNSITAQTIKALLNCTTLEEFSNNGVTFEIDEANLFPKNKTPSINSEANELIFDTKDQNQSSASVKDKLRKKREISDNGKIKDTDGGSVHTTIALSITEATVKSTDLNYSSTTEITNFNSNSTEVIKRNFTSFDSNILEISTKLNFTNSNTSTIKTTGTFGPNSTLSSYTEVLVTDNPARNFKERSLNKNQTSVNQSKIIQDCVPGIKEDISNGINHVLSKLQNCKDLSCLQKPDVNSLPLSNIFGISSNPENSKVETRRRRDLSVGYESGELDQWMNERLRRIPGDDETEFMILPLYRAEVMIPIDDKTEVMVLPDDRTEVEVLSDDKTEVMILSNDRKEVMVPLDDKTEVMVLPYDRTEVEILSDDKTEVMVYPGDGTEVVVLPNN